MSSLRKLMTAASVTAVATTLALSPAASASADVGASPSGAAPPTVTENTTWRVRQVDSIGAAVEFSFDARDLRFEVAGVHPLGSTRTATPSRMPRSRSSRRPRATPPAFSRSATTPVWCRGTQTNTSSPGAVPRQRPGELLVPELHLPPVPEVGRPDGVRPLGRTSLRSAPPGADTPGTAGDRTSKARRSCSARRPTTASATVGRQGVAPATGLVEASLNFQLSVGVLGIGGSEGTAHGRHLHRERRPGEPARGPAQHVLEHQPGERVLRRTLQLHLGWFTGLPGQRGPGAV